MSSLELDSNGKLIAYAWPGGYPVFYLDKEGNTLCPECADKEVPLILGYGINWESSLCCDECSNQIESAYPIKEES